MADADLRKQERVDIAGVRWRTPFVGFINFNVDGAWCARDGSAACWGIARDCDGKFLHGFMFGMGRGSSLLAEIWGVLWGVEKSMGHAMAESRD